MNCSNTHTTCCFMHITIIALVGTETYVLGTLRGADGLLLAAHVSWFVLLLVLTDSAPGSRAPDGSTRGASCASTRREGVRVMIHHVAQYNTSWVLPGVRAHDDVDGDVTSSVTAFGASGINVNAKTRADAPYVVTYRARDAAGNQADIARRRVYVANPCEFEGEPGEVSFLCDDGFCSTAGLCLGNDWSIPEVEEEAVDVNAAPVIALNVSVPAFWCRAVCLKERAA